MITGSELLRRAVRWISAERQERPHEKISKLLEEAGIKFNLSPLQMDSLMRLLAEECISSPAD